MLRSLICILLVASAVAEYSLRQEYSGKGFFDGFNFMTGNDPTNGYGKRSPSHPLPCLMIWRSELCGCEHSMGQAICVCQ